MSIYASPDIRLKTFEEAEEFISNMRVKRMMVVQSYSLKASAKLATLKEKELATFEKRKVKLDAALEKIKDAINAADRSLQLLMATGNNLTNITAEELKL